MNNNIILIKKKNNFYIINICLLIFIWNNRIQVGSK